MNFEAFKESLNSEQVPRLSTWLEAMWYDAKNDWEKAHSIIQDLPDKNAAWIHAYLHRKEGDSFNAGYWYRKAGRPGPGVSLKTEWEQIVKELIE